MERHITVTVTAICDYPLEDDKYAIEQLAQRHSFIDGKKVGIYGHSGGGFMAAAAICTYPDFYKEIGRAHV